ncbi:MAG TPA: acyl-CoA dehydrogenase family protein, partial [Acidimicrobiales bacterium]|nr:acyl-CoA dehydrogenase family protein [Acidimicrobiales bacterium]
MTGVTGVSSDSDDVATDFGAAHDELRSVARDLLGKAAAPDLGRLADAGWLGLEVSESRGGAGATFAEVAVVLGEMGRAATTSPYLGTAVLGVGALNLLAPNPGRDALLGLVASGDRVVAVALPTGDEDGDAAVGFRFERGRLHGRAAFVPDAPGADRLLVPAHHPDAGPVVAVVHAGAEAPPGLDVVAQPVLDATRRLGLVTADGIEVPDAAVWRFAGDPAASVRRLLDRGALAVACDSLGLAEAMLEATVAYAGVRHQFGRPIGSFQAVKPACAAMLVQVSVARELLAAAVTAVVDEPASPATSVAVAMAKSYVGGAAVDVVGKA